MYNYIFFDSIGLQQLTEQAVVFRILLAMIFGGIMGLERTHRRRAAGFRTHILVCMGATCIMMTGQFIFTYFGAFDPARLGAQVISGIGFLGAGTILVTGVQQIKGLTTAAALWASACMGITIGIGFYFCAVVMCVAMFIVMTLFNKLEERYVSRTHKIRIYGVFKNVENIHDFLELCRENKIQIENIETVKASVGNSAAMMFTVRPLENRAHDEVLNELRRCEGLISIEEY